MWEVMGRLGAGVALALLVLTTATSLEAESVPLHMVPRPVLDAVRARFKDARIVGAEKDRDAGEFVYEVKIKHQGQNIDVTLTPDGTMVLIKREIAVSDLPAPAARALETMYPRATYQAIEAVTRVRGSREQLAYYEVDLVTAQRRMVEIRVRSDGQIVKGER